MSYFQAIDKIVIDTNIIFMALYNPFGKCAKILKIAIKGKLQLFSPESVRKELIRILKRELNFTDKQIEINLKKLPINWIRKEIYEKFLDKTKVKHKPDKPIEAVALLLDCKLLSADSDFKNSKKRIDIDKLLKKLET